MKPNSIQSRMRQTGFSLVEIMVGMIIGLLAMLVIMQLLSAFEGQKQATSGSADTQTNGSIALFHIDRDINMAGYPLTASINSPFRCTTLVGAPLNTLSPVIITDNDPNSDLGSDAITITYGDSPSGGIPSQINAVPAGNNLTLGSNLACNPANPNEQALIINGNNCTMTPIAVVAGSNTNVTVANPINAAQKAEVACLGNWHTITYRVNNGNLLMQHLSSNPAINNPNWVPIVTGIVNIQAQYGIASQANSNQVLQLKPTAPSTPSNIIFNWVDAAGIWANPTVAQRNLIKAVHIALIARSPKYEPENVTVPCPGFANGLCAWGNASSPGPTVNMSVLDPNWRRYRYRTYDTIIPIRNIIWSWSML